MLVAEVGLVDTIQPSLRGPFLLIPRVLLAVIFLHTYHKDKMPPKFDPTTPENAALIASFTQLGLNNATATELVRQPKNGAAFKGLVDEYDLGGSTFDDKQAAALVKLSGSGGKLGPAEKGFIVEKIKAGAVKSADQVTGQSVQWGTSTRIKNLEQS